VQQREQQQQHSGITDRKKEHDDHEGVIIFLYHVRIAWTDTGRGKLFLFIFSHPCVPSSFGIMKRRREGDSMQGIKHNIGIGGRTGCCKC
jgi:hypothetical protein